MRGWAFRAVWITLPVTAGAAASDALTDWADAPRILAAVLLWTAWGAGTLALLAPRPAGLTLVRTVAPTFTLLAIVVLATGEANDLEGWGAVAATGAAAAFAMLPDFAIAAANGIAYGDEHRFPLRTPPALFLGPLPFARVVVVGGAAAGPLLLADGEVLWGIVGVVVGAPGVVLGVRALHGLARRWVVLVPAGLVVVDPMTVTDSVLVLRRQVRALRAVTPGEVPLDALDLRLGATTGTVLIELGEPIDVMRSLRGRRARSERGSSLAVAVTDRQGLFERASRRRLPVEVVPTGAPRTR